jgi:hypothetical protein
MQLGACADFLRPFVWSHVSGLMSFPTADQEQQYVIVCEELCQIASDDVTFLSNVITGDEWWTYSYDRDKATILQMESEEHIIFFDIKGIVHKEFILAGQTVYSACYCDVLWCLRESVQKLCPKLWRQKNWLLHHDNEPPNTFPPGKF